MSKLSAEQLLKRLDYETCDLRCVNVSTGGDDYDILWEVIEHHMYEPKERRIGQGMTPLTALHDAFSA